MRLLVPAWKLIVLMGTFGYTAFNALYYTAGAYPSNVFTPGLANVWRDQDGRYCAAATIIRASGQARLSPLRILRRPSQSRAGAW